MKTYEEALKRIIIELKNIINNPTYKAKHRIKAAKALHKFTLTYGIEILNE